MSNIQAAQQGKASKVLDKVFRYPEGVMSRREWLQQQKAKGAYVEIGTKARCQWNRVKYNRMSNHREQEEYSKKCDERVTAYELHFPDKPSFYDITKTEYDYFITLT